MLKYFLSTLICTTIFLQSQEFDSSYDETSYKPYHCRMYGEPLDQIFYAGDAEVYIDAERKKLCIMFENHLYQLDMYRHSDRCKCGQDDSSFYSN